MVSASEKLKTLVERHDSERMWAEAQMDLYRALPQIVAVVKAAERIAYDKERVPVKHMTGVSGKPRFEHWPKSRSLVLGPLAALDEALS